MLTEMYSILKRSALAIAIVFGILLVMQQTSMARQSAQLKKFGQSSGRLLDSTNPFGVDLTGMAPQQAAEFWNDWGNTYSHTGPMTNTLICYMNAIRLMPQESMYHRNLGTCIFMYRKDARQLLDITEEQVFNMAIREFHKARLLDPKNYELAKETALTQFGIKPFNPEQSYKDWIYVHNLMADKDPVEKDEIYLNLARVCFMSGRYDEAQTWLAKVTTDTHESVKEALQRRVLEMASIHNTQSFN